MMKASLLVAMLLSMQRVATVDRVETFNVEGLSAAESVTVDIRSEIQGQLTWIYTDDQYFNINVKIRAENETAISSTNLNLTTTNSSVKLMIIEHIYPIAPAPVTGTGNALSIPAYLVWFLALLIGWNNPMAVLVAGLAYGCSSSWAEETYPVPRKSVEVEVRAPRRLVYKAINLYINGGKLRVVDPTTDGALLPTCKTDELSDGCPHCCHGNGVCTTNQCVCDDNYDKDSSCALSKRQTVLFSHPFDPRFEMTALPNNDILTLSRAYQYIQEPPYLKDPDMYAMEIRPDDVTFSRVLVIFQSNGLVSEITDMLSKDKFKLKLKKSRLHDCVFRLKSNNINLEMNICDNMNGTGINIDQFNPDNTKKMESSRDNRNENETKARKRKRQKVNSQFEYKFIDYPVRIERCGFNQLNNKFVFFHLYWDKIDSVDEEGQYSRRHLSLNINEHITLLAHSNYDKTVSLRFPEVSVPLGTDEIASKCENTITIRKKVCYSSNLETLRLVCENLFNHNDTDGSTPPHFPRIVELCNIVLKTLTSYCDISEFKVLSEDLLCISKYRHSFNLFSKNTYHIRSFALFPDEKLVHGEELKINLKGDQDFNKHELAIIDKEADFKIVRISVIPKDPVPHDIYQVKLDYACATSDTVIKMTVYGSDFYNNDVTCHGITSCSCCILHAAGAPNAVVDHVTINVTDYSRNYSHVREMVVVF